MGAEIELDGVGSTDEGTIETFKWDINSDGTVDAFGQTAVVIYEQAGTYTVTLTVVDDDGQTDSDTATITVEPETTPTPTSTTVTTTTDVPTTVTTTTDVPTTVRTTTDVPTTVRTTTAVPTTVRTTTDVPTTVRTTTDVPTTVRTTTAVPTTVRTTTDVPTTVTTTTDVPTTVTTTATPTPTNTPPAADAGGDQVVSEDELTVLNGEGSGDPDGTTLEHEWTQTGGPAVTLRGASSATPVFTAPSVETRTTLTFRLTVTDADGATDTDSVSVVVEPGDSPTADAGSDRTLNAGESVSFDATGTTDNGDIASYEWDVDGDGTTDLTGARPTDTFNSPGTYQVTLTVTDDDGNTDTDTVNITVLDETLPTAVAGSDRTLNAGESVSFDATGTTDNGDIASYEWDVDGDGTTDLTGPTPTYTFNSPGTYQVTLTVTDEAGNTDTDTVTITVEKEGIAPTADAAPNTIVKRGESIVLDGTGSSDPDGSIESYEWDIDGDGTTDLTGPTPTDTFDSAGFYQVTLTVTDDDGNTDTDTIFITVTEEIKTALTANAGSDQTVSVGETVSFNGIESHDPVGTIERFEWDVDGDGTTDLTGVRPTDTFNSPGTYQVTLTVTDEAGNTDTDTVNITVLDETPPTAVAGSDRTLNAVESVSFDATGTTDNGDIASYEWDVDGDGTTDLTGPTPTYTFNSPGTYQVTLTVTDEAGNTDTDTVTITVRFDVTSTEKAVQLTGSGTKTASAPINVMGGNVSLGTVSVATKQDGTASITVTGSKKPLPDSPEFDVSPDNEPLGYFKILSSLPDKALKNVTITFRVPKQTLTDLGVDRNEVTMYRYTDGRWVAQPTEYKRLENGKYVFETTASGLSEWVAGTERPTMRVIQATVDIEAGNATTSDAARIIADITNNGDADGVYVTKLLLEDEVVEQRRVTVPEGGTVKVTFERSFENSGLYSVTVNNVTAGRVQVRNNGTINVRSDDGNLTTLTTSSGSGPVLSDLARVGLLALLALIGYLGARGRE